MGFLDEEQLAHCLTEGRVLFSFDDDLLRLAASGTPHSGIVYCRQRKRSVGDVIRGLVLIWESYDLPDMAGQVKYL